MSAVVLDAGVFVGIDRGDNRVASRLHIAQQSGLTLRSTGVIVAEVWRDPRERQADLARLLRAVEVQPVDEQLGRRAGELLGRAGTTDAADATVVAAARAGDRIMTSDPEDIGRLVAAAGRFIRVDAC